MDLAGKPLAIHAEGLKKEVGYFFDPPLWVLGRYNVNSGGADAITKSPVAGETSRDFQFRLITDWATNGDVFYEGLLVANEVRRTVALAKLHPTHIIFLSTPLEECLAAVNARRAAKGITEPVPRKNTEDKFREMQRIRGRLKDAGVATHSLDREAAFVKVCELLQVTALPHPPAGAS